MIASFEFDIKTADVFFPLVWDKPKSPVKVPRYHLTVLQLLEIEEEITAIIVPGFIPDQKQYSVKELLDHIRLLDHDKINKLPVQVIDCDDLTFKTLADHHDYAFDFSTDKNIEKMDMELLSEKQWHKLVSIIGNRDDDYERHKSANEWGPYRLIAQLNINGDFDNELHEIKQDLSESRFFKKLLHKERQSKIKNTVLDNNIQIFNTKLKRLENKQYNIALIDDKVSSGWNKAYQAIFPNSTFSFYDEKNAVFDKNKSSEYDLIILDLRLKEEVVHDSSEIFGIEDLSGIALLKKIKEKDSSVPVIMCTASNKSWSYDAAINAGADGFWTKESPDYGISIDYRFNNTIDLLNTIERVLTWSSNVRPLYNALTEIHETVFINNPIVNRAIRQKTELVFSQLHILRSHFIEKLYGQSGLVTAFLAICSLVNDAITFYRKKQDDSYVVSLDNEDYKFCKFNMEEKYGFVLVDDVINLISNNYNPKKSHRFFPENQFMDYILEKTGNGLYRKKYFKLHRMRNHLDIIHSKSIPEEFDQVIGDHRDADLPELSLEHLYQMLEIFYRIFTGKDFRYSPIKF